MHISSREHLHGLIVMQWLNGAFPYFTGTPHTSDLETPPEK